MILSTVRSVALIGSFKKNYTQILEILKMFTNIGIEVTSPKGTDIVQEGIPFVRFTSDPVDWDDFMVQTMTLHRIFCATFVYVVAPNGYIGRTTSYEIGRIIQAQRPLYFSEHPKDLPIKIPGNHIISPGIISKMICDKLFLPEPLYINSKDNQFASERDLLTGLYTGNNE
jgi:hypothetical protein